MSRSRVLMSHEQDLEAEREQREAREKEDREFEKKRDFCVFEVVFNHKSPVGDDSEIPGFRCRTHGMGKNGVWKHAGLKPHCRAKLKILLEKLISPPCPRYAWYSGKRIG